MCLKNRFIVSPFIIIISDEITHWSRYEAERNWFHDFYSAIISFCEMSLRNKNITEIIQLKNASLIKMISISIVFIYRLCYSLYLWSVRYCRSNAIKKSFNSRPMIYFVHERATYVRIHHSFIYYIIVVKARLMCLWPPCLSYLSPLRCKCTVRGWRCTSLTSTDFIAKKYSPVACFSLFFPPKQRKAFSLAEDIKIQYLALKSDRSRKRQISFFDLNE